MAVNDVPPVFCSLEDFSQGSESNRKRYENLVAKFREVYGSSPQFVARAPGRVNVIGEHVDYSGYSVLPMAIEQDIAIACRVNNDSKIQFQNVDSKRYPNFTCQAEDFAIDGHEWYHYLLCGCKGVLEEKELRIEKLVGMNLLMDGSVPPSAGLSSSSALVCCAALVTAYANKQKSELLTKSRFATLCAQAERYIGTEGGGMDQAISFLAEPGWAKMIEFNPLRPSNVHLPAGYIFVISNTLVEANKAAFSFYNKRVVECRLAAQVVAKKNGLEWRKIRKLLQLQEALGKPLSEMVDVIDCLDPEPYGRDKICKILEVSREELQSESLSEMTKGMETFKLYMRASHVFREAERVYSFKEIANASTGTGQTTASTATRLGHLMDDSHSSCSKAYECSCLELDQLVALCKASGALGSRLTGAGWGGCAVSLVEEGRVEEFLLAVSKGYYDSRKAQLKTALFATKPGPGAALCDIA